MPPHFINPEAEGWVREAGRRWRDPFGKSHEIPVGGHEMLANYAPEIVEKIDALLRTGVAHGRVMTHLAAHMELVMHTTAEALAVVQATNSKVAGLLAVFAQQKAQLKTVLANVSLTAQQQSDVDAIFDASTTEAAQIDQAVSTDANGTPLPQAQPGTATDPGQPAPVPPPAPSPAAPSA